VRLLIHFTVVKALNLVYYLYKSLTKIAQKVQHRQSDYERSLFHHSLIKIIILHQLTENNITWETFIQTNALLSSISQIASLSTSSAPPKHVKGSSSKIPIVDKIPRPEVNHTY